MLSLFFFSKKLLAYFLGQVGGAKASSEALQRGMFEKKPTNQIAQDCNVLILCSFSQVRVLNFFSFSLCLSSLNN